MKVWLLLGLMLAVTPVAADTQDRAECFHECVTCKQRCAKATDKLACEHSCLEMRRMCCTSIKALPGAFQSCGCGG